MKTLNIYVTKSFIIIFLMSIGILAFGMLGARMIKVFEYMSQGVPVGTAFMFIVYVMPVVFSLAIPWAILVAVMLVFGRLSADSEITAMRACGVSILQIISPLLMITFALTCFCLYLQINIGPHFLGEAKEILKRVLINQPTAIFEPGRPIKYENSRIHIGNKIGNELRDIQIYRMSSTGMLEQDIHASAGLIKVDRGSQTMEVVLRDAVVISFDKKGTPSRIYNNKLTLPINYGKEFNRIRLVKRVRFLTLKEIIARTILAKREGKDTTELEVELSKRIALALSPIAFLLLGMPLAIRTSRRETSIGLFLSVILAGAYFFSVMICKSLTSHPEYHPQLILWIPNILYQIVGTIMIFRIACR